MKKFILLLAIIFTTNCFAIELHNFKDIKGTLLNGNNIRIVLDFSKCSSPDKAHHSTIGVFTPNGMLILKDHITTSLTHFTLNNPNFLGKPIYEFITYTITDRNQVKLNSQVLDAVSYIPVSEIFSFVCKIDTGAKIFS